MTTYKSPGNADELGDDLTQKWNEEIERSYDAQADILKSRFFTLDADSIGGTPVNAVRWFGDPAEPAFCLGPKEAEELSDWGMRGRHVLHNEYCEYVVLYQKDSAGRSRPKRVEVTTELREYWTTLAVHAPEKTRDLARSVLKTEVEFADLYGTNNPGALTERQRLIAFSTATAGHGNDQALEADGVPAQPTGRVNTSRALFMTHPINGLDDLLYIVMFGAHPYARATNSGFLKTTREQLFREFGVEQLACRHADPAAAMGAYAAAFDGKPVAFANPLGMYITSFASSSFRYDGGSVPDEWIRFSRGDSGWYQRLEFGPGDDSSAFLDDIKVAEGANLYTLTGGFQVVARIEVGPRLLVGDPTPVQDDEYRVLTASSAPIRCSEAGVCERIKRMKDEYDANQSVATFRRIAPRSVGQV